MKMTCFEIHIFVGYNPFSLFRQQAKPSLIVAEMRTWESPNVQFQSVFVPRFEIVIVCVMMSDKEKKRTDVKALTWRKVGS